MLHFFQIFFHRPILYAFRSGRATFVAANATLPYFRMEPTAATHPYLTAVRSGDRALLRQLRDELYPFVRGLVLKNSGTEDDAKDVFQDAVMVVYDKAGQADFTLTSRFSTFFC
ncbi:MAG: RNA polymerase sigma factor, partial [Saprospiraceae bacterium]